MDTHTEAPRLRLDVVAALAVAVAVALYAWATVTIVRKSTAALDRLGLDGGPGDDGDGYQVAGPFDGPQDVAQDAPPPAWAVSPLDVAPPAGTGASLPGGDDALGGTVVPLDDVPPAAAA